MNARVIPDSVRERQISASDPATSAFVAANATRNALVYLPGLAITLVAFTRLAPTAAHLAADDDALRERGCRRSLVTLLYRET